MTAAAAGPGAAMYAHLLEIHGFFRDQLTVLRRAVDAVVAGADPSAELATAITGFAPPGTGGDVRVHCRYYCAALSKHHDIEDGQLFPAMRAAYPEAAPQLDRLQAEHHVVADIITRINAALSGPDSASEIKANLDRLAEELQTHLEYEERVLKPLFGA
jgi:hypothetical protein